MRFNEAIEGFLHWRMAEDYSPRTIANNRSQLIALQGILGNIELDDLDHRRFRSAIQELSLRRTNATMNTAQAVYSRFFWWCRLEGLVSPDWNPLHGMRYRKVERKARKRLEAHEFKPFLDAAPDGRHRILAAIGLYLMLRHSEVVLLKVGDVDLRAGTIKVTIPKTRDFDEMPLTGDIADELEIWLDDYASQMGTPLRDDYYLVPSIRPVSGGWDTYRICPLIPLSNTANLIARVMENYGWTDHKGDKLHALRRSGARQTYEKLLAAGEIDAMEVTQATLHHAHRSMTEHYIGLEGSRAKRDKLLRGAHLFTTPTTDNVIPIHRTG